MRGLLTISKMEIPLGNQILNIELNIFKKPNLKRLTRELSDFFESNLIESHEFPEGIRIKDFGIEGNRIIPKEPYFEESLSVGDYIEQLKQIGKKYGVENLGFDPFCYHK